MRKILGFLALSLSAAPVFANGVATGPGGVTEGVPNYCQTVPPYANAAAKDDCARLRILEDGAQWYRDRFYPGAAASNAGGNNPKGLLSMTELEREAFQARIKAQSFLQGIQHNDAQCQGVAQALYALIPLLEQSDQNYNNAKHACPKKPADAKPDCWDAAAAALAYDLNTVKPAAQQYVAARDATAGCVHEPSFNEPVGRMAYSPLARPKRWSHPDCAAAGAQRLLNYASGFTDSTIDSLLTGPRMSLQQGAQIIGALAAAPDGDDTPGLRASGDYISAAGAVAAERTALHCKQGIGGN